MKKILFAIAVTLFFSPVIAQKISKITVVDNGKANLISFLVDDAVTVNMTVDGNITDWGVEDQLTKGHIYPPRYNKYMGRVEYYTANDNEAFRGKVKYIGRTAITYYASYENETFKGKVKSIGTIPVEYYAAYDDKAYRGKIKNAGSVPFTYFSSFDNEAYRGKAKSIGITNFTYFASFDDKAYQGKIKSVDKYQFTYYSSFEKQYNGSRKTGFQTQLINGINFEIRN